MDFATLKTDVTSWVTENKMTAAAIGIAGAAAVYFFVTSSGKTRPKTALNGIHRNRRRKTKMKLIGLS